MKKVKNLLLIIAVLCFFSVLINLIYFIDGVTEPQNSMAIFVIFYILIIIANLSLGTLFLFLYKKINANVFKTICIISIFCNILVGLLAFYTYYLYITQGCINSKNASVNGIEVDGMEIIEDKRMAEYIDELNHLEEMKRSGIITQEQYNILKNKAISKYLKGD